MKDKISFEIFNWKVKQVCKNMNAIENRELMRFAKIIIRKYKEITENQME